MAFDESVILLVTEPLTHYDENHHCVPQLAESWSAEENGKVWIFHLRKNVKFHDGTDFNADAVKFHFERVLDPKTKSTRSSAYRMIERMEVVDPYTIKFILKYPYAIFPEWIAAGSASIPSPTAIKKYGEDYFKHPVGTGPFKFEEWTPETRIVFSKNSNYYDIVPSIDTVIFKPINDDNTRAIELEKGTIDLTSMPVTKIDRYLQDKRFNVEEDVGMNIRYIGFNTQKPPFDNINIRRAVNYAINREAIVKDLLKGHAILANGPVPSILPDANPNLPKYEYNPEKAKQLLKDAKFDFNTPISLWSWNDETLTPVVQAVKYQMEQVGFKVNIQEWDRTTYWSKMDDFIPVSGPHQPKKAGVFDMFMGGWAGGENPFGTLDPLFRAGSYSNNSFYDNATVNQLLSDIGKTVDIEQRRKLYFQVQQIIVEDASWIFLWHGKNNFVLLPRVHNYKQLSTGGYVLNQITLSD
jgi:peptide/nickel transport system substrate-binding protein